MDTSSEVDSKIATALLDAVTTAALDAALLGKADASALASLLSTVDGLDTPLDVDTKIANALLGLATEAFVAAQLASRDASITALQGAKADATLLASYATNAALSASETALQSALVAELAALQLSASGVVNTPAWAGFTTWELLRGSSVVRNLHFVAPLSAALANGDDTLSITADCYSTAGTDAAIAAALLAYYTSAQVDALLGDYRTGAAQDAETTSAITGALLAYYTAAQVDALLGDYRTASAQDTQTQAAITGALLAYRTGPDQDVFTTNQITSALVAYRSAADQDTATASSIAAALLSYYTIAQVDGLLAGKLGVTEAASALQIAVRFPDDGGADEVVAAIGEQILGPTDVSLSNWTVRPSSGCSVVLATHTAGVSVDGYTLTLAVNSWNIVRTYNLTPGRELLFACRYRLGTASNFVVYMSEADNVYDPLYGSFVGDQGVWSTAKMYFTVPPNGVAKLHFGAHFHTASWSCGLWLKSTAKLPVALSAVLGYCKVAGYQSIVLGRGGPKEVVQLPHGRRSATPSQPARSVAAALGSRQGQLQESLTALGAHDRQPAQFFVKKRSSEKSEVLVTVSVLEAKSCGAETVPELVTSPHTTLPVDTPPLVAVKVQSRLSQRNGPAVMVSVAPGGCEARCGCCA